MNRRPLTVLGRCIACHFEAFVRGCRALKGPDLPKMLATIAVGHCVPRLLLLLLFLNATWYPEMGIFKSSGAPQLGFFYFSSCSMPGLEMLVQVPATKQPYNKLVECCCGRPRPNLAGARVTVRLACDNTSITKRIVQKPVEFALWTTVGN